MKTLLAAVVAATLALCAIEANADAMPGERKVALAIESTSLATALDKWAQQSGFQIFVDEGITKDLIAPDLNGTYTAREALEKLLAGTPLAAYWLSDKAVSIRKKRQAAPAAPAALQRQSSLDGSQAPSISNFSGDDTRARQRLAQSGGGAGEDSGPGSRDARAALLAGELTEVLVVGTQIRGQENKTVLVDVIDRKQIQDSGHATTQDLFRSLPQNFAGGQNGLSDDGRYGGGSKAGQNFTASSAINLRGLGESSTLVLLNGHRIAPAVFGTAVDISTIPLAAIERIEILSDGSSALYGSDAVGGVVNIILRSDYSGAETSLRYGSVTDGDRDEKTAAQVIGGHWDGGGLVAALQYQSHSALSASERDFSSRLTVPNELLPDSESYGVALNGRQELGDRFSVYGDVLWSRRDTQRDASQLQPTLTVFDFDAKSETLSVTPGMRIELGSEWSIDVTPNYSKQTSTLDEKVTPHPFTGTGVGLISQEVTFEQKSADVIASGRLLETAAGGLRAAFGASYREEELDQDASQFGTPIRRQTDRHVSAAFAEFYLPLVTQSAHVPGLAALDLSAAVRYDDYSDFGSVTNPQFGVRWAPVDGLDIRARYGKSFRAPNASESLVASNASISVFRFLNPNAPGLTPTLAYTGGAFDLAAERARTTEFGIEYKPSGLTGLSLNLDYYSIRYEDRIVTPPFSPLALQRPTVYGSLITPLADDAAAQAYVNEAVASGATYTDFVGTGVTGVRNAVDFRQQNAASVRQSGGDAGVTYVAALGSGNLSTRLIATYIHEIETQLAAGTTPQDLVSTYYNPVDWRFRGEAGWSTNGWAFNGAVNYTNDYENTNQVGSPSIGSWTTVDLQARFEPDAYSAAPLWHGVEIALSAQNVFDKDPPFVNSGTPFTVNYDPANASPLGRFVALELRKSW
ncbi:MAG TPA: TonB-dependent receptor [Steroidobacteraceae bacterium]|nr:TonB-dependent receptor [Steroidobacteraceae bacterium]